ncbi:DUF5983 family protein [Pseudomonas sp. B392_1p]|uniref:DUF5983 family protein n=1 Tax=Pseudomonas sp. B392_1p TaxID=3457507 RepID=UPI003FD00F6C
MSHHPNPFRRGYQNLHICRELLITGEDHQPPVWRPLHPSQAHLPDDQITRCPCIFSDEFALITESQLIPHDLEAQCRTTGVIQTVTYAIHGDDAGQPMHIGDACSKEAAREVVQRLSFETGHYSRSWEISAAHVDEKAIDYLLEMSKVERPSDLLFVAFRIPGCPAIGMKLIATPWTTANLLHIEGITAEQLRQEHEDGGVPPSLVNVLHQAADADVRFLVLDADAPALDGLPLYET